MNTINKYLLLFTIACLCVMHGVAQGMTQESFLEVVDRIVLNNKNVAAVTAQNAGFLATLGTTNRLDAPELSFGHQWGQRGVGNKWNVGISQSFDWPGLYSARRKANALEAVASQSTVAKAMYDARCNVAQAIASIIYYRHLVTLYRNNLSRVDSLLALYETGFRQGEVSILDVDKLRIERISARRVMAAAEQGLSDFTTALTALNGGASIDDALAAIKDFPQYNLLPMNSYIAAATDINAELLLQRSRVSAAQASVDVARMSRFPGFSVGYSHDYELGEDFNGVQVGVTLPFLTAGRNVEAARINSAALEAELEALELSVRYGIEGLYKKALILYDEQTEYAQVLADDDSVRLLNLALRQGQITLIDYLLQVNYFTEAKVAYLEVQYNYLLAAMALDLQTRPASF